MSEMPILTRLESLIRDVFDDDELVATPELALNALDILDSLGRLQLLLEVQDAFAIELSGPEFSEIKTIEQLAHLIQTKVGSDVADASQLQAAT